jgi:hypothetical protein
LFFLFEGIPWLFSYVINSISPLGNQYVGTIAHLVFISGGTFHFRELHYYIKLVMQLLSLSVQLILILHLQFTILDPSTFPTLWVGTSLGSVLTVMISVPPPGESRLTQPVIVSPIG